MARHDREDPHSLEDQLAWLDAIKEMPDEVEIAVSAVTSATLASPTPPPPPPAEPEPASPYPNDPWSLVPSEPASGALFRSAVDSVYGPGSVGVADDTADEDGTPAGETASASGPAPGVRSSEDAPVEPFAAFGSSFGSSASAAPSGRATAGSGDTAERSSGRDDDAPEDDYPTSPPGTLGVRESLAFGEKFGRGAFGDSPADTDSFNLGAFADSEARKVYGEADSYGADRDSHRSDRDSYADERESRADAGSYGDSSGSYGDTGQYGDSGQYGDQREPYGDAESSGASSGASSAEEPVRGWLEPALPVELSAPVEQPSFPAEPPKESPFPQKPVFPKDAAFGKEPAFGQESAFGQDSGFGKDSAFGQESAFGVEREESFAPPESGPHVVGAPPSRSPAGFKDDRFTGSLRDDLSGEERQSYERDHGSADERQPYGRDRGAERQPYERDHGAERQPYDRDHGAERQPYDRDHGAERQPYDRDRGIERQPYERDRGNVAEQEPYQPRRRQAPQVSAFSSPARAAGGKPPADSLDPVSLLKGRRNAPAGGWRKLVYKASAGWIKPGEPPEVRRRRELINRARTPVATGHHRVAVLSLKGGVGKTTTTVGLGATLAQVRGDRVIAVDANPDRGTLSDKVELETSATVRDLLNERAQIKRYVDIRAFTSQAPSRLEILASDRDPSVSEAFSAKDYHAVSQVLENFYSICITDCGTGLLHSAMSGVLGLADQIVLVSSPSVDGARAASATLDWLEAHHYGDLVKAATVVLCSVRPRSKSTVDLDRLEAHFAARCRAVVRVPYDPHLEEGAEIDLDRLQEATREAYLRLAASVGDGFAGPQALGERRFSEIPDQL